MKKVVTFAMIALFASSMVACKKDYTCTCNIGGQEIPNPLGKQKKSDAEDACDALNAAAAIGGGSCSL